MKKRFSTIFSAFLSLGVLMMFSSAAWAQGGATCATATAAAVGTNTTAALTGTGAALDCFATGATSAAWFTFTPPSDGAISIASCGGGVDTRLSVYSGTCAALNCIASNDDLVQLVLVGATLPLK